MPWQQSTPYSERRRFVDDWLHGHHTMKALCERYSISRKTGYKWLRRYREDGLKALKDGSRRPKSSPSKVGEEMTKLLCAARRHHPTWGARKLLDNLEPKHPELEFPAASTVGDLLKREGLVKGRVRRTRYLHPGVAPVVTQEPNDLWTADFKGHFKTRDGVYCYPLTVADLHTRKLLGCDALLSTKSDGAKACFTRLFREYGMPKAIRTDNGVPFASNGLHGLISLNVWWMRLGIVHQRILPAHPQQNGAHERMHRTMKAEATRPPQSSRVTQQRTFDLFRAEYNDERPHETLKGKTPSSQYTPSPREYPERLAPIEYPAHYEKRFVNNAGTFRFKNKLLFIASALKQNYIGLEEVDDGLWNIHFCNTLLATLHESDFKIRP
ncbi:MAG: IS481 family transposase [Phycisphaerae bacterium]|nr:IS481 family transposase [Phycisphaerae bacterium]